MLFPKVVISIDAIHHFQEMKIIEQIIRGQFMLHGNHLLNVLIGLLMIEDLLVVAETEDAVLVVEGVALDAELLFKDVVEVAKNSN